MTKPQTKIVHRFRRLNRLKIFRYRDIDIYCSILSKKELLSKPGLKDSKRRRIIKLMLRLKVLKIDENINKKYMLLIKKYGRQDL